MPTRDTNWPEGTPCWTDLMVSDGQAARAFYGVLFGWDFEVGGEETGFYSQGKLDGRTVAGIGQPMPGQEAPPPAWMTYLAADDVDTVVGRITEAGGTVFMPAMEVMGFGRMAVAADTSGCVFGLWQGLSHTGMQRYNENGAVVWNEAHVLDFAAAKDFYAAVFGYTFTDLGDEGFHYVTVEVNGETVGGLGDSADGTAVWLTYFQVEDADALATRAVELGGTLLVEPRDSPYGRIAEVAGPAGERFALIVPAPGPAG
ncbi:MAG: VOC family protein [Mycobacteriales bacterium]